MVARGFSYLFLTVAIAILAGCGGGAMVKAPVAPTQAIVKMRTSGTLPSGTTIDGIQATLTYPTTKGLSITKNNVVASGVASGLFESNVTNSGQVGLILVTTDGFQTGEFATLTFGIAAGNSPVAGDFAIASGARVIDTNSATLTDLAVEIQSVTFQ